MVSALDDVCNASAPLFDAESLAAMLREVCHWLVEQRLGPHAHHEKYKMCDPYGQVGGYNVLHVEGFGKSKNHGVTTCIKCLL